MAESDSIRDVADCEFVHPMASYRPDRHKAEMKGLQGTCCHAVLLGCWASLAGYGHRESHYTNKSGPSLIFARQSEPPAGDSSEFKII
jgi:hypothetical protein